MSRSQIRKNPILWVAIFLLNALVISVTVIVLVSAPRLEAAGVDSDGDGLTDVQEGAGGTIDTAHNNGLLRVAPGGGACLGGPADAYHILDPNNPADGLEDFDGDGIKNGKEAAAGTEVLNWDSYDNDGTSDACEDTDEDYLTNEQELRIGLLPMKPDSNGDGITDDRENDLDKDGAGIPKPDRLDNWQEFRAGTDPKKTDTDSDGIPDHLENFDKDGLNNEQEFNPPPALKDPSRPNMVFDPLKTDTDGDGTPDHLDTGGGFEGRKMR